MGFSAPEEQQAKLSTTLQYPSEICSALNNTAYIAQSGPLTAHPRYLGLSSRSSSDVTSCRATLDRYPQQSTVLCGTSCLGASENSNSHIICFEISTSNSCFAVGSRYGLMQTWIYRDCSGMTTQNSDAGCAQEIRLDQYIHTNSELLRKNVWNMATVKQLNQHKIS